MAKYMNKMEQVQSGSAKHERMDTLVATWSHVLTLRHWGTSANPEEESMAPEVVYNLRRVFHGVQVSRPVIETCISVSCL